MLLLMTNAINEGKTTASRSWIPISANIMMTWRRAKKEYATVLHWLMLRLHIHMTFSWMLVVLNLQGVEL